MHVDSVESDGTSAADSHLISVESVRTSADPRVNSEESFQTSADSHAILQNLSELMQTRVSIL